VSAWNDAVEFNDLFFPAWREADLVYLSNALAGEVGEVCNDTKHAAGGGTNRTVPSKAHIAEELADVYLYIVVLAERLGFDEEHFTDVVLRKLWLNVERMAEAPR